MDELNDDPGQNQELLPENGNDMKIQLEKVMIVKMDDVLRKLANVTSHRIQKKGVFTSRSDNLGKY